MDADVVVAGAGHNSLIAGAYLARAGFKVLVLEARDVIGGNTVSEELTLPGFSHDSCSSAHVLIQSNPLMRNNELGLDGYGLQYVYTDPAVVMPFEDGSSLTMWRDRAQTVDELTRFSARDAAAYQAFLEEWDAGLSRVHGRLSNNAPGPLPDDAATRAYERWSSSCARDIVFERFEHDAVRSLILWLSFATIQDVRRPGTGILPFAVTAGRQEFGWATPRGGSGRLPAALAALIQHHGGAIITGAPVTRILVESGRASGVVTATGERYRARRAVLSTIHAARLSEVLPEGALPPEFRAAMDAWRPGLTLFAVHLALPRVPSFATERGWVSSAAGAYGSPSGLLAQIDAHDAGRTFADDPWILVVNPCVVDPGRAPAGAAIGRRRGAGTRPPSSTGSPRAWISSPPTPSRWWPSAPSTSNNATPTTTSVRATAASSPRSSPAPTALRPVSPATGCRSPGSTRPGPRRIPAARYRAGRGGTRPG